MQGVFDACKQSIMATTKACLGTLVYKKPCLVLGRYVAKVALILSEVELQMHVDESLGGSQAVFLAGEGLCAALQQAESLTRQCCETGKARIWPLEDAIEFQSVALELLNAVSGLASSNIPLPEDVKEDIDHVQKQLQALQFTEDDLEDSENFELKEFQTEAVKYSDTATGHLPDAGPGPEPHQQRETETTPPTLVMKAPGVGNVVPFGEFKKSSEENQPAPSTAFSGFSAFAGAPAFSAAGEGGGGGGAPTTIPEGEEEEPSLLQEKPLAEGERMGAEGFPVFSSAPTPSPALIHQQLQQQQQEQEQQPDSPASTSVPIQQEAGIPAPDENIMAALDQGSAPVYVNLEDPSVTAMPPGFPAKGTVVAGEGKDAGKALPQDPFSMDGDGEENKGSGSGRKKE